MRFVWAVVAFVLAAVMIGAGIAQRTILQGPRTETTQVTTEQEAPYTLIDGAVLGRLPGAQTLRAQGVGELFAAYGRTIDLQAWLSDVPHNVVTLEGGEVVTTFVEPAIAEPEPDDAATEGEAAADAATEPDAEAVPAHDLTGSDLWLDQFQQEDVLVAALQLPDTMSVLVASDGVAPAPSAVSVSWPIGNGTPWAGPLMVGGGILLAVGVFLYILGIRHARRSRGPRRKGLPMPVTEPVDLSVEGEGKGVVSAGTPKRRAITGRRTFIVLPAVAVSALLFAGCSADAWPTFGPSPTPTPTSTLIVPEDQQQPAVTDSQAERILARIADTVAEADETLDSELAATRLDGIVLAERETNYVLRAALSDHEAPAAIPAKPIEIILPQAYDGWPRTVMTVVTDDRDKSASIMLMTQADPWSPYKLTHQASLEAATEMPDLAPAWIGAAQVPPDNAFLLMPPNDLPAAYADVLDNGEDSAFAGFFEADGDQFRASVTSDRERRLEEFNQTGASTGSLTFGALEGDHPPVALATVESGAIVAITIKESDTVQPTNTDAVIKLTNNPVVQALVGVDQSATGFVTVFSDQLFFYVPAQGSSEKIRLLGYGSEILDAAVIS